MDTFKEKLKATLSVALLFSLNVYLFAPTAVYEKNIDEFSFGILKLVSFYIAPLIVIAVLLAIEVKALLIGQSVEPIGTSGSGSRRSILPSASKWTIAPQPGLWVQHQEVHHQP